MQLVKKKVQICVFVCVESITVLPSLEATVSTFIPVKSYIITPLNKKLYHNSSIPAEFKTTKLQACNS